MFLHFTGLKVVHSDQGVIAAEAPFLGPTLTPSKLISHINDHEFLIIEKIHLTIGITPLFLRRV